jgi:hypothetical protein
MLSADRQRDGWMEDRGRDRQTDMIIAIVIAWLDVEQRSHKNENKEQ